MISIPSGDQAGVMSSKALQRKPSPSRSCESIDQRSQESRPSPRPVETQAMRVPSGDQVTWESEIE
ncbi:hypothetical protein BH18ACT7_BH18ACT7_26090 [soil metagenome]